MSSSSRRSKRSLTTTTTWALSSYPTPPNKRHKQQKTLSTARGVVVTPNSKQQQRQQQPQEQKEQQDDDDDSLSGWINLHVPPAEFRPSATLTTGQCFHWTALSDRNNAPNNKKKQSAWGTPNATRWMGVLRVYSKDDNNNDDSIVVQLRETPVGVYYKILHAPPPNSINVEAHLRHYFQLDDDTTTTSTTTTTTTTPKLTTLYQEWSAACPRMAQVAACLPGVRLLGNQDPWECLVSFLCSSNNNIPRIVSMLHKLRTVYGSRIVLEATHDDNDDNDFEQEVVYSFPSFATLRQRATEADLRQLCGMGYRAKYLMGTIQRLETLGGEAYLHQLRRSDNCDINNNNNDTTMEEHQIQQALTQFPGVGRKVADCVALFSLNCFCAVPIDVHVWNIARRDYGASQTTKTLSPTVYREVGDLFRQRFPNRTGWAHTLLFVAELPSFRSVLPANMVEEMDAFAEQETNEKKKKKKKQASK